jgi:beta-glucosidase
MFPRSPGLFDPPADQPFFKIGPNDRGTAEHTAVAVDAARQSMTLLRNKQQTLPLKDGQALLVVGPYAAYGASAGASTASTASTTSTTSTASTVTATSGSINTQLGLLNGQSGTTRTLAGCKISGSDKSGFAEVTAAVKTSDVVVLALGTDTSKVSRPAACRCLSGPTVSHRWPSSSDSSAHRFCLGR